MEQALTNFGQWIQGAPWLAFVGAYAGGLLTASNPCVLVSIPLVLSFVGGREEKLTLRKSLIYSVCMVAGLAVTFVALGLVAAVFGRFFGVQSRFWPYAIAAVCLLMGLHMLGWLPLRTGLSMPFTPSTRGALGAFILGLLFGVISTPCAVPILAVLLTFIAQKGSLLYGGALLLTYALGHSSLVIVGGVSMGAVKGLVQNKGWQRTNLWLRRGAGALIILLGIYVAAAPHIG